MKLSKSFALAAFLFTAGAAVLVAGQAPQGGAAPAGGAAQTPAAGGAQGGRGGRGAAPAGGGGGFANAYPQHSQADQAAIDRGKLLFSINCSFCHGSDARGGDGGGPNLLRSQLVM